MDKWSVALFGHYKPRYELRENEQRVVRLPMGKNAFGREQFWDVVINRTVGYFLEEPADFDHDKYFVYHVAGWEKRAAPGDVIAFKPYAKRDTWTETERKEFLIVTVEGPTLEQMAGTVEPEWDLDSYIDFKPETFEEHVSKLEEFAARAPNRAIAMEKFRRLDKEKDYEEYLTHYANECAYPTAHLKKRRMHIHIEELEARGVHLPSMLDREFRYSPDLMRIHYTFVTDKMKQRNLAEIDRLNLIPPRKVR